MPVCLVVTPGVVGHPTRHLGQRSRRSKNSPTVGVVICAEQSRCDIAMKIMNDRGVQMATTYLPISRTERLHHCPVGAVVASGQTAYPDKVERPGRRKRRHRR